MTLIEIASALCLSFASLPSADTTLWDGSTLSGEGPHYECVATNLADPELEDREDEAEAALFAETRNAVPLVLRVPEDYPTVADAQHHLDRYNLQSPATIEVAAGTYQLETPIRGQRDGRYITIKCEGGGTVSDYHDLWPIEDMEASVREEWGVVFEVTRRNAVEMDGQQLNIDGCAFVNTGEAVRGLTTGAWGGRHGDGAVALLSNVAVVNFATAITTEYGGSVRSTKAKAVLLANNGTGLQIQYGGTGFLEGAVVVGSTAYGVRVKQHGLAYMRSALIAGGGGDGISMIGGGSANAGLALIKDNAGWGINMADVSNVLAVGVTLENNAKGGMLEPSGSHVRQ